VDTIGRRRHIPLAQVPRRSQQHDIPDPT